MSHIFELRQLIGTKPIIVIGALVAVLDDQQRILLQHRTDDGTWGPIGGALEPGERLEDCAARELLEETGLNAESFVMYGVESGPELYHRYPNGDEIFNVTAFFLAVGVRGQPVADGLESASLGFFPLDALPEPMNAINRRLLGLARDGLRRLEERSRS